MVEREVGKEKTRNDGILHLGILSIFLVVSIILTSYYGPIFRDLIKEGVWHLTIMLGVVITLFVFFLLLLARYIIKGSDRKTKPPLEEEENSEEKEKQFEDESSKEVYFGLAKNKLEDTSREFVSLGEYMGILITADSMAAVLIGIIFSSELSCFQTTLLVVGIILVIASIGISIYVLKHTNEDLTLDPEYIEEAYETGKLTKKNAAEEINEMSKYNEKWLRYLSPWVKIARKFTAASLFLLLFLLAHIILT